MEEQNQQPLTSNQPTSQYQQGSQFAQQQEPQVSAAMEQKKRFPLIWLVVWLAAWPLAFAVALASRILFSSGTPSLINIFVILVGFYGVIGWIPFVVVLIRSRR